MGLAALAVVVAILAVYWSAGPGAEARRGRELLARLEALGPPADFFPYVPRSTLELYALAPDFERDLQYIPCYCGCEPAGHRSNRDCFLRSSLGARPVVWDPHAAG